MGSDPPFLWGGKEYSGQRQMGDKCRGQKMIRWLRKPLFPFLEVHRQSGPLGSNNTLSCGCVPDSMMVCQLKTGNSTPGLYLIGEVKGTLKIRNLTAWERGLPSVLICFLTMSLDYFRVITFYNKTVCQDCFQDVLWREGGAGSVKEPCLAQCNRWSQPPYKTSKVGLALASLWGSRRSKCNSSPGCTALTSSHVVLYNISSVQIWCPIRLYALQGQAPCKIHCGGVKKKNKQKP